MPDCERPAPGEHFHKGVQLTGMTSGEIGEGLRCHAVQGVSTDPEKLGPRAGEVEGRMMLQLLRGC